VVKKDGRPYVGRMYVKYMIPFKPIVFTSSLNLAMKIKNRDDIIKILESPFSVERLVSREVFLLASKQRGLRYEIIGEEDIPPLSQKKTSRFELMDIE